MPPRLVSVIVPVRNEEPFLEATLRALQTAIALARGSRLGHNPGSHIYSDQGGYVPPQSVAVAYQREVFVRVGFFDEAFDACEDVEFNHRLAQSGVRCYLAPELTVRY